MYVVLKQFIAGNSQIWVAKINPDDPEYIYDTEQEAADKATELEQGDSSGRKYKAAPLANI
jgi:hypothetical protein